MCPRAHTPSNQESEQGSEKSEKKSEEKNERERGVPNGPQSFSGPRLDVATLLCPHILAGFVYTLYYWPQEQIDYLAALQLNISNGTVRPENVMSFLLKHWRSSSAGLCSRSFND